MSVKYEFQHDRAGDTAKLTVSFQVQDRHGPMGAAGVGSSGGWLDGEINDEGKLTAVGGGEYRAPAARPGVDPFAPEVRLAVRRAGTPISSVVFRPVLASADATTLNVNDLLRSGRAVAATPEMLANLADVEARARAATLGVEDGLGRLNTQLSALPGTVQSAANSAAQKAMEGVQARADDDHERAVQDRAGTAQATTRANDAADVIGAAGLLYAGTDAEGIATLVTVEPRVTVTNETAAWAVIDGSVTLTQPTLTIGGTA